MLQIQISQFEQLLPFVAAASEDVFTKMQPSFESHYDDLVATVVGTDAEQAVCAEDSLFRDTPETMSYWPPSWTVCTPTTSS